jgi:hypothetical protein
LQTIDEQRLGQQLVDQTEHTKNLLDQLVARFEENSAHVAKYSNADGLARGMGELRKQTRAELDNIVNELASQLAKRAESLRARLVTPPSKVDDQTLLQLERRMLLRQLDPLEILPAYLESCRVRDVLTWMAVESAAPFDPIRKVVTSADIESGRRIRTEVEYPDVVSALAETEKVISALQSSVRSIETHCGVRIDPIATLADGVQSFY